MQSKYTSKDIARFLGKVDKNKSATFYNGTRCQEWAASCNQFGYGHIKIEGVLRVTHRLAYELNFGEIPDGLFVLHHCDNPSCCNPAHLFLGTQQDNMDDRGSKNRTVRHEKETNGRCLLSEVQILEIRKRYGYNGKNGDSSRSLAKEFGISPSQILRIVRYESWID